jgi:hypothetical protein
MSPDGFSLFASGWELPGNKRCATGGNVAMARRRAAINDDGRVAGGNGGNATVAFFRAGNLVADTGDTLSSSSGSGGATNHGAAMICGIADDDKGACHVFTKFDLN